jgi:cell wall-associated NlpC family hydrolase
MRFPRPFVLTLLTCAVLSRPAGAAPDAPPAPAGGGDAVLQMLQNKGLLPAAGFAENNAFVRQMRDTASDLVLSAMNFLGVPYRRGGGSADDGFDCSGFTRHVFEMSLGLVLPRRAEQQAKDASLANVGRDELKPGDLVFFNTMKRTFSHVGIYIGDGKFIHSPRSGSEVRIEDMREAYWAKRYNGARRADTTPPPLPTKAGAATLPALTGGLALPAKAAIAATAGASAPGASPRP